MRVFKYVSQERTRAIFKTLRFNLVIVYYFALTLLNIQFQNIGIQLCESTHFGIVLLFSLSDSWEQFLLFSSVMFPEFFFLLLTVCAGAHMLWGCMCTWPL